MGLATTTTIFLVGAALMAFMSSSCCGHEFYVGWVEHPPENYSSWAARNRFQVHDKLIFKYKKEEDSVLVVTEPAYGSCSVTDPIGNYSDGNTTFQLNRSGPFYFISGGAGHCARGQKLDVVVMAIRPSPPPNSSPPPSSPPAWVSPPPSSSSSGLAVSKVVYVGAVVLLVYSRAFIG